MVSFFFFNILSTRLIGADWRVSDTSWYKTWQQPLFVKTFTVPNLVQICHLHPTKRNLVQSCIRLPTLSRLTGTRVFLICYYHHHHHQYLNREGRWGTTDNFATSFLHFSLFSTALWDLPNSRPVYSLMLSSHLFLCPPCLLPPFTVPCKMVLARPDERETWPYHCSLRLFTIVRRSSCGPIACWILARTSSLVT